MTAQETRLSSEAVSRQPLARLDFLELPLPKDARITRASGEFIADSPWTIAHFGEHLLMGGWWVFEAESDGDLSGVEVRLSSCADPLLVLQAQDTARLFLQGDDYQVSLLLSPWPVRRRFGALRMRRLGAAEGFAVVAGGAARLLTRDKPLQRVANVAKRLLAGQSLGVRLSMQPQPRAVVSARTTNTMPGESVTVRGEDCFAVVNEGDRLHPRALEIAGRVFSRFPHVQAIYADRRDGGHIVPRPMWDDVLARHAAFAGTPAFFREAGPKGASAWTRLAAIAQQSGAGAIARIALPLAERETHSGANIARPEIPALPHAPIVSVVIPTKYQVTLLEKCLAGLAGVTGYPNLEVVVVDNGCEDPRFHPMLAEAERSLKIIRIEDRGDFNFPRLIDAGVKASSGEVVLLLNDDIEPIEAGWLHRILASVLEPGVGAVGARLNYPSGDIQHAGVMLGLGGVCGHLWKGASPEDASGNAQMCLPGRRSAVTGACLAVRRQLYDAAGGLDRALAVAFNDIDFCLRLDALGHRTIYRGDAVLVHHESQSRGPDDATIESRKRLAAETRIFLDRWREATLDDPFGSPAFDRRLENGAVHPALLKEWPTD